MKVWANSLNRFLVLETFTYMKKNYFRTKKLGIYLATYFTNKHSINFIFSYNNKNIF